MRKRILNPIVLIISLLCSFTSPAQTESTAITVNDSISTNISELLDNINRSIYNDTAKKRFKLYPTENIYNFLKLDTQTGKIQQVQWSLKSEEEFSVTINNEDLSKLFTQSSFELYPTKNIYQFLLLDKTDGRVWHVQWGTESNKRWITRIY